MSGPARPERSPSRGPAFYGAWAVCWVLSIRPAIIMMYENYDIVFNDKSVGGFALVYYLLIHAGALIVFVPLVLMMGKGRRVGVSVCYALFPLSVFAGGWIMLGIQKALAALFR